MILLISSIIAGIVILILGGNLLVRSSLTISAIFNIPSFIVGLTVVAFGTSAPELFVTLNATIKGSTQLAMGNIVGSNICNIGLVLGLSLLFSKMTASKNSRRIDWPFTLLCSVLLLPILIDKHFTIIEGIFILVLFASYTFLLTRRTKGFQKEIEPIAKKIAFKKNKNTLIKSSLLFLLGILGLTSGSELIVRNAPELASHFKVSERIIGIMVVSVGTSLPELSTSIIAAVRKKGELALGNLLGSNIFNVCIVGGISALSGKFILSNLEIKDDIYWMLGVTLIAGFLMLISKTMSKIHGSILLLIYVLYVFQLLSPGYLL